MGKIPEGWLNYTPIGKVIEGTRFICFKVPLNENVCRDIPLNNRCTPNILMENINDLKLVIDLTNTAKYYNGSCFMKRKIEYQKLNCVGRVLPSQQVINEFFTIVDRFLQNNPSGLIGVHCTHGLNRTGYMVCRYLIIKMKMQSEEAIKKFEAARGHTMERPLYLTDLRRLSPCNPICAAEENDDSKVSGIKDISVDKLNGLEQNSLPSGEICEENKKEKAADRPWRDERNTFKRSAHHHTQPRHSRPWRKRPYDDRRDSPYNSHGRYAYGGDHRTWEESSDYNLASDNNYNQPWHHNNQRPYFQDQSGAYHMNSDRSHNLESQSRGYYTNQDYNQRNVRSSAQDQRREHHTYQNDRRRNPRNTSDRWYTDTY